MAIVLKDRVKETASAPGTGTITLGGAASGFQAFSAVGNGNVTYFAIVDAASGAWEVNYGTYTSSGATLTRNATPLSSSAAGALVNFTGAVDVFCTYPSENAVWQDTSGTVVQQSFGAITATSAALTSGTITTAPSAATDIVNKEYADSISSGLNYHQPVNYASTAALPAYTYNNGSSGVGATITALVNGALSLGGGSPTATQRVLVKDEVSGNAPYNGVYVVTQAGTSLLPFILTRATDYDTSGVGTNEIDAGDYILVISGTLASTAWVQQTPLPITVGTTGLVFIQFNAPITYYAGTGLNLSPATTFNISNVGTSGTYGSASAVPVFVTNAQGQVTSVTNTNIAISGSAVSGNISGSAGSVANALTLGTYLTGTSFNGSSPVTATVDATSANTASKVVARDGSGNFSAGTITAALSGNATTATTATNVAGGAANKLVFNASSGTTSFADAPTASGQVLGWNGSAFAWTTTIATATNVSGTVAVANGGTGATSLTANNVILGNGTSAVQAVAPSTSGNVLTSNGTTWVSAAASSITFSPLTYTYTGTLTAPPIITLTTPQPAQAASSGGAVDSYSGKWASNLFISRANGSLTTIEFTDLQGITNTFSISLLFLTTLSFPVLTTVNGSFTPTQLNSLTTLTLTSLKTVGVTFDPNTMSALTTLSAPALTTVGTSFTPNNIGSLTTLSLTSLTTVGSVFNPNTMASLTTLSLPALTTVGANFTPNTMASLTTLSLPALTTVGVGFNPTIMNSLTSISIPVIQVLGAGLTSGNAVLLNSGTAALTTFTLPLSLIRVGNGAGNVSITSAALNQTSVDSILVRLAALDGTAGTTSFDNRTVTITGTSSTPSATGLTAKATLVARGCTVTNN